MKHPSTSIKIKSRVWPLIGTLLAAISLFAASAGGHRAQSTSQTVSDPSKLTTVSDLDSFFASTANQTILQQWLKNEDGLINQTTSQWAGKGGPGLAGAEASAFGWLLFAFVNSQADDYGGRRWEVWPSDPQTFTTSPTPQTFDQIVSANKTSEFKFLSPPALSTNTPTLLAGVTPTMSADNDIYDKALKATLEEVHRNSYVYNYIIGQNDKKLPLYTQKQLLQYLIAKQPKSISENDQKNILSSGKVPASFQTVKLNFDPKSLEVKANWMPLLPGMKQSDYLRANYNNSVYVLVAMHIISKAIPQWYWVSWEHKDNPLYGRQFNSNAKGYAGGQNGNATAQPKPPKDKLNNDTFGFDSNDKITAGLQGLFNAAGLGEGHWQNYRMVVWQNNFTAPIVASNSITEAPEFTNSGSCMTCHATASYGGSAGFGTIDTNFKTGLSAAKFSDVTLWDGTHVETLTLNVPKYGPTGTPAAGGTQKLQLDQVWGFIKAPADVVKPTPTK